MLNEKKDMSQKLLYYTILSVFVGFCIGIMLTLLALTSLIGDIRSLFTTGAGFGFAGLLAAIFANKLCKQIGKYIRESCRPL